MNLKQFLDKRTDTKGAILRVYTGGMPEVTREGTWTQNHPADRTFEPYVSEHEPIEEGELCGETIGVEHREGRRPNVLKCQVLKATLHEHHIIPQALGDSQVNQRMRL